MDMWLNIQILCGYTSFNLHSEGGSEMNDRNEIEFTAATNSYTHKGYLHTEEFTLLNHYGNSDINLHECGLQRCVPGYTTDTCIVRRVNVIHFIISGKGTLRIGSRSYHLKAGQGFLSPANVPVDYQADDKDPWLYCWIHFNGIKLEEYLHSMHINQRTPVFNCSNPKWIYDCIQHMMRIASTPAPWVEAQLFSIVFEIFASIMWDNEGNRVQIDHPDYMQENYIQRAIVYMQQHLLDKSSVAEISDMLGLTPNYFSTIFRRIVGCTPQSYLVNLRLQYACSLLLNTNNAIKNIAKIVGYDHATSFSKAFAKQFGMSPNEYRIASCHNTRELLPVDPAANIKKHVPKL